MAAFARSVSGLHDVPSELHGRVLAEPLRVLPPLTRPRAEEVRELTLSKRGIEAISPDAFEALRYVQRLFIDHNALESLAGLAPCTRLRHLYAGHNKLRELSSRNTVLEPMIGLGYYGTVKSYDALSEIGMNRLPSVESLFIMSNAQEAVDSAEHSLLSRELGLAERQAKYAEFEENLKRAEDAWKVYASRKHTPEEKTVAEKFYPAAWESWKKDHQEFVVLSKEYDKTVEAQKEGEMMAESNVLYKKCPSKRC